MWGGLNAVISRSDGKAEQLDHTDTVPASLKVSPKGKHNMSRFDLWCASRAQWPLFALKDAENHGRKCVHNAAFHR